MRKNYIIKDARRILAEQIRDNGMNTMNKNPITNATGLSADIAPSIKWTVRMAWGL